ncbi:MAG: hypothetical protein ACRD9Y_16605, partial [Blastocatellia bacterium]
VKALPTGKWGTGKDLPGHLAQNFDAHPSLPLALPIQQFRCIIVAPPQDFRNYDKGTSEC